MESLSLHSTRFFSNTLELTTSAHVILPEQKYVDPSHPDSLADITYPTLWLLHGLSDDDSGWTRQTSIERYANERGVAVVMPQVGRSFYADMTYGNAYWTFLTKELPVKMRHFFPLSTDPRKNYVAGLSMGGYGAFKWAFNYPEQFAAAASFSGVMDLAGYQAQFGANMKDFDAIFAGQTIEGTPLDLFWLANEANRARLSHLKLYQSCGTEDFLYEQNVKFRDYVAEQPDLPGYTYSEGPGGHEWSFWDKEIKRVIDWLPLP
ncbi:esterase family protein [Paenibacillus donghaensis]|uniref:alpha/beta hydrolase n=1 Tax=Paenibacillus donghaensis TaxID=414771 RepID=UPI0018842BE2|nr:esterase family protein [Paenibacillus donghaensis]